MTTKTAAVSTGERSNREVKRLFAFMNLIAWASLAAGLVMSLWNVGHFSDENLTLMLGIGFMVGSVFIYTIGTAIRLVEERKLKEDSPNV